MSTNAPRSCPAGSAPYTIARGDTLYLIAQRLGTTVQTLLSLNPGLDPNALQVGQIICVPGAAPPACPGPTYVIQPGDTFYTIAARYGVTVQALQNANPGVDPLRLTVGQTICIPTPSVPATVRTPCGVLLAPVTTALPPGAAIPLGALTVRQMAMSSRAYTAVAEGLPTPSTLGNFNSYNAFLRLYNADLGTYRTAVIILTPVNPGTQPVVWAGGIVATEPPVVGDVVEVRPVNTAAGLAQGPALLQADLSACRA